MDKKKLWLTLSALSIATSSTTLALSAPEQVGVVNKANVAVKGQVAQNSSKVLFVGSDVYHNETIRTDKTGQVHLMFLDQSSLTIGPNSKVVIDSFVYDPKTNDGHLSISAARGILRFVGGALSKKGNVSIKTPVGNLGIRGAVVLIEIAQDGSMARAFLLYGDELKGTAAQSNATQSVKEHEDGIILSIDGTIRTEHISADMLQQLLAALQGPLSSSTPSGGRQVNLPDNYSEWLRELSRKDTRDSLHRDEQFNINSINRDIDNLAS